MVPGTLTLRVLAVCHIRMKFAMDDNSPNDSMLIAWLQLMHLADSALPIGGLAHSFGVETLVEEAGLAEPALQHFFSEWLHGTGHTEAAFCIRAHTVQDQESWQSLNLELSALKLARESREASLRLGRRFLSLAASLIADPRLHLRGEAHLATAFGLVGSTISLSPAIVCAALLHQTLFGAVSACQRLLPFGQTRAMHLLWSLKPQMSQVIQAALTSDPTDLWNLQPMLEIASMRHPHLGTRLFIS
jgi:urease accessory protein